MLAYFCLLFLPVFKHVLSVWLITLWEERIGSGVVGMEVQELNRELPSRKSDRAWTTEMEEEPKAR